MPSAGLDQALIGPLASFLAVTMTWLGVTRGDPSSPRWLRIAVRATLVVLAVDVQLAALILLLGPTPAQDGILAGDVRLRNALGLMLGLAVWFAVFVRPRSRARNI